MANERTIEQKISDAGPTNQRINPHILTQVLTRFVRAGRVVREERDRIPWYYLPETPGLTVEARLAELQQIHAQTVHHDFTLRLGQALEIAVFRALESLHADRKDIQFFGSFHDLDEHDDSTLYSKIEPVAISGRPASGAKVVDFVLIEPSGIRAAIEAKNVRQWLYPDRQEIRELLLKSCDLNAVPVLVARRIPYVTFKVLNACGVLVHENFNQFYPETDHELATLARDKRLLGYHDIRLGNDPDARLLRFIKEQLPILFPAAWTQFRAFQRPPARVCGE